MSKTIGKVLVFLFLLSNITSVSSLELDINDSYSLSLKVDNKNIAKIYDDSSVTQYFTYVGKDLLLNKEVGISTQFVYDKKYNNYILIDNFLPNFFEPISDLMKNANNLLKYKKIEKNQITYTDKKTKPTFIFKVKNNKDNLEMINLVSTNINFNKYLLKLFNIKIKKFNKIEINYKSEELVKFNKNYLSREEVLNDKNLKILQVDEINKLLEKILLDTNAEVEKKGLSFITTLDLNNTLAGYDPIKFIDIKMLAVKEELELYSFALDKYFCGKLFRYDYFIEQSIIEEGRC
jgi:hypothetical protein